MRQPDVNTVTSPPSGQSMCDRLLGRRFSHGVSRIIEKRSRSNDHQFALQPQEEAKLIALAQARGLSTEALVREALDGILADAPDARPEAPPDRRPIWEVIAENMKHVPPEDLALLPQDGASQIDHYLYGHPKR